MQNPSLPKFLSSGLKGYLFLLNNELETLNLEHETDAELVEA